MPTMSPETIQRWTDLHAELSSQPKYSGKLAGLFKGHIPETYALKKQRILYIGKATEGKFGIENASSMYFNCNGAAFWALARRFSTAADPSCNALENVAWSNLCKIGTISDCPVNQLADAQHQLAVESLQEEITRVQPTLIVCVAEGYQDHFFYEALQVVQGKDDGFLSADVDGVPYYYRGRRDSWPPILWMKHPQLRKRSYVDAVVAMGSDLMKAI